MRHLRTHSLKRLLITNRSEEKAIAIAVEYAGECIAFEKLASALTMTDIVISATGSTLPIITKELLKKHTKPIYILDLAVPRDIDPEVSALTSVHLYCIDDLKTIIQHNLQGREHAAEKANEVINEKSRDFMLWLASMDLVAATISTYRKQIEAMCQVELSKAMRQLQKGDDPVQVLASFAHAFTNKLLHTPSVQLRQAGVEGRFEILQLAQQLFATAEVKI